MPNFTEAQISQLQFLQRNLRKIRSICEWSVNDFANVLGLTRQTINNLEMDRTSLTPTQFLSIAAMIERRCQNSPELFDYLNICFAQFPHKLDSLSVKDNGKYIKLQDAWFSTFPKQFPLSTKSTETACSIESMDLMEKISNSYKIILCPDVLLAEEGVLCVEELGTLCQASNNPIILPATSLQEIEHLLYCKTLEKLNLWNKENKIKYVGEENDPPLAELIISKILKFKTSFKLCIITDNQALAADIQKVDSLQTISGHKILIIKINKKGYLELWNLDTIEKSQNKEIELSTNKLLNDNIEVDANLIEKDKEQADENSISVSSAQRLDLSDWASF